MNFRDPILEQANRLLLALARNDSTIVANAIREELAENGEVNLEGVVKRVEEAVATKHAIKNGAMAAAAKKSNEYAY